MLILHLGWSTGRFDGRSPIRAERVRCTVVPRLGLDAISTTPFSSAIRSRMVNNPMAEPSRSTSSAIESLPVVFNLHDDVIRQPVPRESRSTVGVAVAKCVRDRLRGRHDRARRRRRSRSREAAARSASATLTEIVGPSVVVRARCRSAGTRPRSSRICGWTVCERSAHLLEQLTRRLPNGANLLGQARRPAFRARWRSADIESPRVTARPNREAPCRRARVRGRRCARPRTPAFVTRARSSESALSRKFSIPPTCARSASAIGRSRNARLEVTSPDARRGLARDRGSVAARSTPARGSPPARSPARVR